LPSVARRAATIRASEDVTALRLGKEDLERLFQEMRGLRGWFEMYARTRVLGGFLKKTTAFRRLSPAVIHEIAEALVEVEVEKGEAVIREGDPPGPMFIIERGKLRVVKWAGTEKARTLAYLRDGDFVGELSVLKGAPRSATVEALAPCTLLALEPAPFRALLETSPEFRRAVEERVASFNPDQEARLPLDFTEEMLPAQALVQATAAPPATIGEATERALRPGPSAPATPAAPVAAPAPEAAPATAREPPPAQATPTEEHPFASAEGHFKKRKARRRFPFIYQVDEMDCGVACLAMICRHHGRRVSLARIRQLAHTATDGTSLANICRAAEELGLAARTARVALRTLDKMPLPAILHWEQAHWVVLVDVARDHVRIADPAVGDHWVPRAELEKKWSGYAGLFDFTEAFRAGPDTATGLGWILPYFAPYKGVLAQALVLAVVAALLTMLVPVLTQVVVDHVVIDGAVGLLGTVIIAMGATFVTLTTARLIEGWLLAFVAVRIDAAALDFITRKLLALPMSFFQARRTGDIQRRLDGVRHIRELLVSHGIQAILAVVQLAVALALMMAYSPKLTGVYAAVLPLYVGLMFFSARYLTPLFDKLEEMHGKYRSDQLDAIKGIEAVKSAGAESSFRTDLLERFLGAAKGQFKADYAVLAYQGAISAVEFLSQVLFLWIGALLVMKGEMTLGGLIAFASFVAMANAPLGKVLSLWDRLQVAKVLLNRLSDIFENEPEQGRDRSRLLPVKTMSGAIELRNVSFRYGGPESPAIVKAVSLAVPAGKTIALVGRSGSGKTTLVKLLAGLLEPTEGTILFDGVDQKTLNYRDLRRHIGFVLQENHMFSGTILENIAFGVDTDLERAIAAAKAANAHDFIQRLPLGYETRIGESGIGLSGGQRQRIAIARAIYRRPAIIIFDEATSALDTESERVIQDNMKTLLTGRTAFLIAHRLSTVRDADRIIVLEKGEIIEQGSHDELMDRRGIYFYLVSRQVAE
jgi:ATP-binding cassette subfamily B protein